MPQSPLVARRMGYSQHTFGSTIVDSGTSFMYLPPAPYQAVVNHWRNHCPWGSCSLHYAPGDYSDDYCYSIDRTTLLQFDSFTLHFSNGVSLPFGPLEYAYELYAGLWCMGIFDNEHSGAVLGGECHPHRPHPNPPVTDGMPAARSGQYAPPRGDF